MVFLLSFPKFSWTNSGGLMRAVTRLVLQLPRNSRIRLDMKNKLHWLDFPTRSIFKLRVAAYCCQRGQAPAYLSELINPVSTIPGRSHRRSAATGILLEPACRTVTLGPRAFSSCPRLPGTVADLGIEFGGGGEFPFRPWIRGGLLMEFSGPISRGGSRRGSVNSTGGSWGSFPARFRRGVVDEVPWNRRGGGVEAVFRPDFDRRGVV